MSRLLKVSLWLFLGSLLLIVGLVGFARFSQSQPSGAPVVRSTATALREVIEQASEVPVRLPDTIPPLAESYFASISDAQKERYSVSLDFVEDCYGVRACSFGQVTGEEAPTQSIESESRLAPGFEPVAQSPNPQQTVTLAKGIQGYFIPYVCGANCSDSKVVWEEGGYRYSVGIKGGSLDPEAEVQQLIEMANSAILESQ